MANRPNQPGLAPWAPIAVLLVALSCAGWAGPAAAQCPSAEGQSCGNRLRPYRGVRPRLFQKSLRHELSALGGIYAADLLSASYLVGGAYTFHPGETLGLEILVAYGRAESELAELVEDETGAPLVQDRPDMLLYQAHLLWSLAYGKLRFTGGGISRFDLYLALGGGVTDTETARGPTVSAGLGLKVALSSWFALRLDVRDQLLQQEVVGRTSWSNNVTATLGASLFLPFEEY